MPSSYDTCAAKTTEALDDFRKRREDNALEQLARIPAAVASLEKLLSTTTSPAAAAAGGGLDIGLGITAYSEARDIVCAASAPADLAQGAVNKTIKALLAEVTGRVLNGMESLRTIRAWMALIVPQIKMEGNNFGVEVQGACLKHIAESIADLSAKLDAVRDYHTKRAAAMEKLVKKTSTVTKTTTMKTNTKGSAAKEEEKGDKETTTSTSEETTTAPDSIGDLVEAVHGVDVSAYFQIRALATSLMDQLAVCSDLVAKNMEKITKPRAKDASSRGGYNSMY